MKIGLAQIQSMKGNLGKNLEMHLNWVEKAVKHEVDALFFPELSLTGYEPTLAKKLAIKKEDRRLSKLQDASNKHTLLIGAGAPIQSEKGIHISMLLFQPNKSLSVYHKQLLHEDEAPFFICGNQQVVIDLGNQKLSPAICYESLHPAHLHAAIELGSTMYLSSVAKHEEGVKQASQYFSRAARANKLPILMVNSIGYSDNFLSAGGSAVWDRNGLVLAQMSKQTEGLLTYDFTNGLAKCC